MAHSFGAKGGARFARSNSGLQISVATGHHDWENRRKNWADHFFLNILIGVATGPLEPDIIAPLTYADDANGIGTTMQAVFAHQGIPADIAASLSALHP